MQSDTLIKLHKTLLEILDYVVDICEENNITYFLIYGTALGAYRHKEFIPWDDDLDIAIPRDDYNKFIHILESYDNHNFSIQYEANEKKYYHPFAKVRKKGTVFIEDISQNMYENNGIYIDIFPLDYIKEKDSLSQKIRSHTITYLKHILRYSAHQGAYKNKRNFWGHVFEHIICIPAYILPKSILLNKLNKLCIGKCLKHDAKYIAQYYDRGFRNTMPIDVFFPPRKISFCNKEYNVPNKIEEYLTTAYGTDYMELPPIEERKTHQPIEIKF